MGDQFGVTSDGTVYASNVDIKGKINANKGSTIGGWNISTNGIYKEVDNNRTGMYSTWSDSLKIAGHTSADWRFLSGPVENGEFKPTFGVTR
jgi:hypothetical protein